MANTNTTASLHWNVAAPTSKPARITQQWIQSEQMDATSDTDEAMRRTEIKYMLKIPKDVNDSVWGGVGSRQQVEEL